MMSATTEDPPQQKHIDAAKLLIDFFTHSLIKFPVEIDHMHLRDQLSAFVNTDFTQKTCDPKVHCSYEKPETSSLYTADGIMALSEYITAVVCEKIFEYEGWCDTRMFGFSFKIGDVAMKLEEIPGQYPRKGHFDINTTGYIELCPYGSRVYYNVHKRLASYMEALPPMLPCDFLAARYDQLVAFAKNLLKEECETNNPNIRLIQPSMKSEYDIRLSLCDYLALVKANFTFEYPYERGCLLNIPKMGTEPTPLHTRDYCFVFNEDHKKALATYGPSIQALLETYEKKSPAEFFSLHFEEIKKKLGL